MVYKKIALVFIMLRSQVNDLTMLKVGSILKKKLLLFIIVFIVGCSNADDAQYNARLAELKAQEKTLNKTLNEQKKIIDLQQKKRLEQFIQLGGIEGEFEKQLELERGMSTEEMIKSTDALKKQIEDQNKILFSLKKEAFKAE